ncbi:hypothetical protein [Devosia sp. CN2-171]|uniref:hypothetical protein n=1 Tax=Devosia sp. CN2-171 TaxID=3400909 RepID=UPI003BF8A260
MSSENGLATPVGIRSDRILTLPSVAFIFALVLGAVALTAAYFVTSRFLPNDNEVVRYWLQMFDINGEGTIPSWFSSALWLLSSALAILAAIGDRQAGRAMWHWLGLASVFALLSLDEAASLHENIGYVLDLVIHMHGALAWSWVFFGALLFTLVAAVFGRFILTLPIATAATFVVAALVFLAGALGVEMYSAAIAEGATRFPSWLNWTRILALEELLEMLGVIINLAALLQVLRGQSPIMVRFR